MMKGSHRFLCLVAVSTLTLPLVLSALSGAPDVANADIRNLQTVDPQWQLGDSWRVKYAYKLVSAAKSPFSGMEVETEFFYTYTVQPDTTHPSYPGIQIVKILVESEDELEDWELLFDRENLSLLQVEEIVPQHDNLVYFNPFGSLSWMPRLDEYSGIIVHDFPRLQGRARQNVRPLKTGTSQFEQQRVESFSATGQLNLNVVFQRTDPVSSKTHKTTINWLAGKKWWENAQITLNEDVVVRGERL